MNIDSFIKSRRTCHIFNGDPIERDHLITALETAVWAPNHHLTMPWKFWVLGSKMRVAYQQLMFQSISQSQNTKVASKKLERMRNVAEIVIAGCEKSDDKKVNIENYASCSCAIHNFSLSLWQHQIACKWSTHSIIQSTELMHLIAMPQQYSIIGVLYCGLPSIIPKQERPNIYQTTTFTK